MSGEQAPGGWYLETVSDGGTIQRVRIYSLPFRVGRRQGLELVLPADSVSKLHAEIYRRGQDLRLRDLGSRNGSFVNRALVEDVTLVEGDIIHFADFEFRVGRSDVPEARSDAETPTTAALGRRDLPHRFAEGTRELRELLREGQVTMVFQPIVLLSRGTVAAYEALGRGRHPRLPESPLELLRIAESIGREAVEAAMKDAGDEMSQIEAACVGNATAGLITGQEMIKAQVILRDMGFDPEAIYRAREGAIGDLSALHRDKP